MTNEKPLISICIPTYNRCKSLQNILNSIVQQNEFLEDTIEIVVSDNASTDETKEMVAKYNEAFSKLPGIFVQKEIPESDTTRHLYILRIVPEQLTINRRQFFDALGAENVCCNVHYIPVYYFPYYEKLGYHKGLCPNAEKLYNEIISLPLYYAMTNEDVESVIEAVTKIATYYAI